jgi:hypothetical protein
VVHVERGIEYPMAVRFPMVLCSLKVVNTLDSCAVRLKSSTLAHGARYLNLRFPIRLARLNSRPHDMLASFSKQ